MLTEPHVGTHLGTQQEHVLCTGIDDVTHMRGIHRAEEEHRRRKALPLPPS